MLTCSFYSSSSIKKISNVFKKVIDVPNVFKKELSVSKEESTNDNNINIARLEADETKSVFLEEKYSSSPKPYTNQIMFVIFITVLGIFFLFYGYLGRRQKFKAHII